MKPQKMKGQGALRPPLADWLAGRLLLSDFPKFHQATAPDQSKISTLSPVCVRIVAAMAASSSRVSFVAHGSGVGRATV